MKSTNAPVSNRDVWRKAFPADEARRAAQFLRDTWETLIRTNPNDFRPADRENKHTEKLYGFLASQSLGKARLTGFWNTEVHHHKTIVGPSGELKAAGRIRKDITYQSNANNNRLDLIFEFKKLSEKPRSWRNYREEDGMRRFVDGNYAHGLPVAMMVGMVIGSTDTCVDGLKRSLLARGSLDDLRMVSRGDKKFITEPSTMFPGIALFDTEHNRPAEMAPSHGTMLLSHMFVSMPNE